MGEGTGRRDERGQLSIHIRALASTSLPRVMPGSGKPHEGDTVDPARDTRYPIAEPESAVPVREHDEAPPTGLIDRDVVLVARIVSPVPEELLAAVDGLECPPETPAQ